MDRPWLWGSLLWWLHLQGIPDSQSTGAWLSWLFSGGSMGSLSESDSLQLCNMCTYAYIAYSAYLVVRSILVIFVIYMTNTAQTLSHLSRTGQTGGIFQKKCQKLFFTFFIYSKHTFFERVGAYFLWVGAYVLFLCLESVAWALSWNRSEKRSGEFCPSACWWEANNVPCHIVQC